MKNHPEILALSNDAQAVLAGHWMMGVAATLTIRNQQSRLSQRGLAAITELVSAGIISDEKADDGYAESRTYRLTKKGAAMEFNKSLEWMDEHGKFSITERISDMSSYPPGGIVTDTHSSCRRCGADMQAGIAMAQTLTAGAPDLHGSDVVTLSPAGPGAVIECRKCSACGWSVTAKGDKHELSSSD